MLIGCRKTLVRDRARGLVGYDVALTRRRSPVRIRPGPWYFEGLPVLIIILMLLCGNKRVRLKKKNKNFEKYLLQFYNYPKMSR
jgi:hypothetical protein